MSTDRDVPEEEHRGPEHGPEAGRDVANASQSADSAQGAEGVDGTSPLNGTASLNGATHLNGAKRLNGAQPAGAIIDNWARRYGEPLKRFFVRRGTSVAEAEDLTQEVYVRIARMDGVDSIREPEAFLFQTAANLLRDNVRRSQARRTRHHVRVEEGELAAATAGPDRVLEGKQSLESVLRTLQALTARQRDVFVLHRFEDMTYTRIAEHLGISTSAVEKHMMKAIARLHRHLEDR